MHSLGSHSFTANHLGIKSGPHVMLMPKDISTLDAFPSDPFKGEPYTMFAGNPYAHTMIPLDDYYMYQVVETAGAGDIELEGYEVEEAGEEYPSDSSVMISCSLGAAISSLVLLLL